MMQRSLKNLLATTLLLTSGIAAAGTVTLTATVRDFQQSHEDFQINATGVVTGLVQTGLGPDGKPVYNGGTSLSTEANFDQWYNDTAGVNQNFSIDLVATETFVGSGVYNYTNNNYFPLNNLGFGNEGNSNNYHFTTEIKTLFTYESGQDFSFTGDDDVWVYINGQLVVDLGGVHGAATGAVDIDTLGLTLGNIYTLDIFHAERRTTQSNFSFTTSAVLSTVEVSAPSNFAFLGLSIVGLGWASRKNKNKK